MAAYDGGHATPREVTVGGPVLAKITKGHKAKCSLAWQLCCGQELC